jgi:16S rRNA (cytosine1402-N4)-methyltransferase
MPNPPLGHIPVLRSQVMDALRPSGRGVLLDCTVGAGGHARALLDAAGPEARLIGIDLDEASLTLARANLAHFGDRVRLFQANFADVLDVLAEVGVARVDLLVSDLGFASTQLSNPQRGLSFLVDGPLDMRLTDQGELKASDLVNRLAEADLANVIYTFGEERYSRRIARAIVEARRTRPIERTAELARIVAGAVPAPARSARQGVHPATRTFQALRIRVNDEMGNLDRLLAALPDVLAPSATAGIISFHSLEDRRVKLSFRQFAEEGIAKVLTRKPLTASPAEVAENPRSRSAKLRAMEWIG